MNRLPSRHPLPRALVLATSALAMGLAACPKPTPPAPPPDPDGRPEQARPLVLEAEGRGPIRRGGRADSLHRRARDLDDWSRIEVSERGSVRVTVATTAPTANRHFSVAITDERGLAVAEPRRAGGRDRVEVGAELKPGTHLIWVGSEPEVDGPIPYEISVEFKERRSPPPPKPPKATAPAPQPPQHRWETISAGVLEMERKPDGSLVALIRGGRDLGLANGQRGRFIDAGREIGAFRIIEVYDKGSRVRVEGALDGAVLPSTEVQVDFLREQAPR